MPETLTKTPAAMLPMDDISNILKQKYNFITSSDSSADTVKVASVPSTLIAKAATNSDGTITQDRDTIKNALMLGGVAADGYTQKTESDAMDKSLTGLTENVIDEVMSLKDELYSLKNKLYQYGLVEDKNLAEGFSDAFRNNEVKYEANTIGALSEDIPNGTFDNTVSTTAVGKIQKDDYVIFDDGTKQDLVRVSIVNMATGKITFAPSITNYKANTTFIRRTRGSYTNRSFSFSKIQTTLQDNPASSGPNDDTRVCFASIKKSLAGYGIVLKINDRCGNALSSVTIQVKKTGDPGNLICYAVPLTDSECNNFKNWSYINSVDELLPTFTSIKDLKSNPSGRVIYTSNSAPTDSDINYSNCNDLTFIFDGINQLDSNRIYCFIIQTEGNADSSNYWSIRCGAHARSSGAGNSEQNFLTCYYCEDNSSKALKTAFDSTSCIEYIDSSVGTIKSTMDFDILLNVATKNIIDKTDVPYTEGVYTANMALKKLAKRAMASMRINKQGIFSALTPDANARNMVRLSKDSDNELDMSVYFHINDTVIVGNNISTITAVNSANSYIQVQDSLYFKEKDPVYVLPCRMFLTCDDIEFNNQTGEYKSKLSAPFKVEMTPTDTIESPSQMVLSSDGSSATENVSLSKISDKIIFKTNTVNSDAVNGCNTFTLQIYFKTALTQDQMQPSVQQGNSQIDFSGRIYDLVVSFNDI